MSVVVTHRLYHEGTVQKYLVYAYDTQKTSNHESHEGPARPKELRRVALHREGGHHTKGKAEEPQIEARREKPRPSFRKIAAQQQHQKQSPAAGNQNIEPSSSPQGTSSGNACGTIFRLSLSSLVRGRRAPRISGGGGRGAHPLNRAGEKIRFVSSKQPQSKQIYAMYAEGRAISATSTPESKVRRRRARLSRAASTARGG